jgi:hypothetical protein
MRGGVVDPQTKEATAARSDGAPPKTVPTIRKGNHYLLVQQEVFLEDY